jgi:hypothetical protein
MIAVVKRVDLPVEPESDLLAALRDAVRQAGAEAALLTAPLAVAECARD